MNDRGRIGADQQGRGHVQGSSMISWSIHCPLP
jgi:hypothetical protein